MSWVRSSWSRCGSVAEHIAAWTTPLADPAGQTSLAAPSFPARTGCQPRPARRRQLTHDHRRRRPGGTQRLFADRKPFLKRSFQPAPQPGVLFWHANEHGRIYRTLCGCNGGHVHDHLKRLSGAPRPSTVSHTCPSTRWLRLRQCHCRSAPMVDRPRLHDRTAAHVRNPPTAHHVGARRGHGAR